MSTTIPPEKFHDAQAAFAGKVEGRLHAYIKEVHQGRPAVTCIWNEAPDQTFKEVVFLGQDGFDALAVVRAANKSMSASVHVVRMLIDLYTSQNKQPVGEDVDY